MQRIAVIPVADDVYGIQEAPSQRSHKKVCFYRTSPANECGSLARAHRPSRELDASTTVHSVAGIMPDSSAATFRVRTSLQNTGKHNHMLFRPGSPSHPRPTASPARTVRPPRQLHALPPPHSCHPQCAPRVAFPSPLRIEPSSHSRFAPLLLALLRDEQPFRTASSETIIVWL